jgi:hypothetical protein
MYFNGGQTGPIEPSSEISSPTAWAPQGPVAVGGRTTPARDNGVAKSNVNLHTAVPLPKPGVFTGFHPVPIELRVRQQWPDSTVLLVS